MAEITNPSDLNTLHQDVDFNNAPPTDRGPDSTSAPHAEVVEPDLRQQTNPATLGQVGATFQYAGGFKDKLKEEKEHVVNSFENLKDKVKGD